MGRKFQFFPTCGSPSKTLSFRATMVENTVKNEDMESMIKGVSSDRFFFKPGKTSSILEEAKLKENNVYINNNKEIEIIKESEELANKENVSMMEMESTDPFLDFKKSMQEMVESDEGLKEWDNLQELLSLYLAVNDKINHGYIIGAFVDLLVVNNLGSSSSSSSTCSSSSSSLTNGHEQSLMMESSSSKKKKMMICSKSPESILLFTSSSSAASSSGTCSSTSNCLSSCSLEEDDDEDNREDHNSPQDALVSD